MIQKIILDCDPGHDDAVAIMLALASPELNVLGITTTHGNVGLELTSRNARIVRELCDSPVKVFAGADRPLLRNRISAESVHGRSGLEGPELPEPVTPLEDQHAVQFLIEQVLANPGEVTLVPIGPLTNIALAMRMEPRFAQAVQKIVLMGGSTTLGNWSPAAEFNILCDPHAARIVFESGVPIAMFGLNLTHQVLATPERAARLRALPNRVGPVVAELIDFFKLSYMRRYGFAGPAMHDVCAVAHLLRPTLFEMQNMFVEIDTTDGPSVGRTICDVYNATGKAANAEVAMQADAEALFDFLIERLASLP